MKQPTRFFTIQFSITEDDLRQLQELFPEEPKTPPNKNSITQELENLPVTPTEKPTIALNDRPRKRKPTAPSRQLFRKQRKSEEATLDCSFTKNPQFQFNLTDKIKRKINQWRIVFWDPKRQELTLENPSFNFQRISLPLDQFQKSIKYVSTFTEGEI